MLSLLVVARPQLLGSVDVLESIHEVWRVVNEPGYGFALMAMQAGDDQHDTLIGTLGVIRQKFWYGPDQFFTDRWFFVLPQYRGKRIGAALLAEADAIVDQVGDPLIINLKQRANSHGSRVIFARPRKVTEQTMDNGY
jgi:GNAT superfamily N-acetyltransferase